MWGSVGLPAMLRWYWPRSKFDDVSMKRGRRRGETTVNTRVTPVAVIGMACRLPAGIDSPDLLWAALLRGDDLIT
jgi:hypothetical protein